MEIVKIILTPLFSLVILFILTKIIGYRQMSQLSMFDYINGITIGSIAAEVAISPWQDMSVPLVALVVFGLATMLLSVATDKSIKARRFISGEPVYLVKEGQFYEKNFKRIKIDINEFLIQCRNLGWFDVSQIHTAIMEPNGKISVLPNSANRPANPSDLNLQIKQEEIPANIIIDGKIMYSNLETIGFDKNWLYKQMNLLEAGLVEDVFLATCTREGVMKVYNKQGDKGVKDICE